MRAAWRAGAVLVVAALPAAHAGTPAWVASVRAAAVARAGAPLDGEALTAALVEAARARAGGLPQLRLTERGRLGLDGGYALELDGGASVPVWAPEAAADRRLAAERLAATRRQLLAERRAELHDTLADAVALLAAGARLRALDGLAASLREAGPGPGVRAPLRLVDVQLLAAGRDGSRRRAEALRRALTEALGVPIPPVGEAGPPGSGQAETAADPIGFGAAQLEPARCVAASDAVALARLAVADGELADTLARARARTRADLDLGGSLRLAGNGEAPSYTVRLGVSVRLAPWSPATGAASLAVGNAGLEQSLTARWPNRAPGAPPAPAGAPQHRGADPVANAEREVRRQLTLLVGQEADLVTRRRILLGALAEPHPSTLTEAYRTATLALQLVDTDQALGVTRLDAALLCGALPP